MLTHLACIMDGNRRYAKKYGWVPYQGHLEGAKAASRVINFCYERQIPHLSLYAFSQENAEQRSPEEINFLFKIITNYLDDEQMNQCKERGIRLMFVGDRDQFPGSVIPAINTIEQTTKAGTRLTVYILFYYGGQQEIVAGVKKVVDQVQQEKLSTVDLTPAIFNTYLWMGNVPAPDLIIRTGGHKRLSNFLLYHAAYSELCFMDCMWPEVTTDDLEQALKKFGFTQRNFGV